jgi:hypothetical protein
MVSMPFLQAPRRWNLDCAKQAAEEVLRKPALRKALVQALFSGDEELRKRAADTARRITEKQPELLFPFADRILGVFSESDRAIRGGRPDNWRTRAHLGLVAARVAQTRQQRLRVAGLLRPLLRDPGNVVRCTGLEGLGLLALREPSLRAQIEPELEEALATGTLAMKNRAYHALKRLRR